MEPEDGVIGIHGIGDAYTPAFTDLASRTCANLSSSTKPPLAARQTSRLQNLIPGPDRPVTELGALVDPDRLGIADLGAGLLQHLHHILAPVAGARINDR